jgi:hypothetical protein
LRAGTGVAKIDLRPGSAFLEEMNEHPWPKTVPVCILGGILLKPPPILLPASHRGMPTRLFAGDTEPPAIAPIVEIVSGWTSDTGPSADANSAFGRF